jgi:hypothetical protein
MQALTFDAGGKTNTEFFFTIEFSAAASALKNAMTGDKVFRSGTIFAVIPGEPRPLISYTVNMRGVRVLQAMESRGATDAMILSVGLSAEGVQWTYYHYDVRGTLRGTSTYKYP